MTAWMHSRGHRALRGLLEQRRREAAQTLHDLREALPADGHEGMHAEDEAVDGCARETGFALAQMASEMLRTIDDAIRRLEQGGYAVCADCGREIGTRRLEALPFAVRCWGCQARLEAAERVQRGHDPDDTSRRDLSIRPRIRRMYLSQGAHPRSNGPRWKEGP